MLDTIILSFAEDITEDIVADDIKSNQKVIDLW